MPPSDYQTVTSLSQTILPLCDTLFSDDPDLVYQLNRHANFLVRLCSLWQVKVRSINVSNMPESWGPAEDDVLRALVSERQAAWDTDDVDGEGEDDYIETDSEDEDCGELLYASEVSAIADAYRESSDALLPSHWGYYTESSPTLNLPSTSTRSPRKRNRID
jgi:hypothetical protein